jgi:hypothetical protein
MNNIPDFGDAGHHDEAMRDMADEITNNETLLPYLVASNTVNRGVCLIVLHSIKQNSTGFGRGNALPHGKTLGPLLGEMVDT